MRYYRRFTNTPPPSLPNPTLESTENDCLNQEPVQKVSNKIIKTISIYEEKFKVFSSLNVCTDEAIYDKIRGELLLDLNIEIETLFPNDYDMILAAFFGQKYAFREVERINDNTIFDQKNLLPNCDHPLHTVMVMCYAANFMKKLFIKKDFGHALEQEKYEKLKEHFEEIACKIINHLENNCPGKAETTLQSDYKSNVKLSKVVKMSTYDEYLDRKFSNSKEIMAIAYKAEAMKFLSQKSCLNLVEIRYKNRNGSLKKLEIPSQPSFQEIHQRDPLLNVTCKLRIHMCCRALYILNFAIILCAFPVYDRYDRMGNKRFLDYFPFLYVLAVLIAQIFMTFVKVIDYLFFYNTRFGNSKTKNWKRTFFIMLGKYFKSHQLAIWRVGLVLPLLLLETVRFVIYTFIRDKQNATDKNFWKGVWIIFPILLEILYCVLFAIATISSLRFFYLFKSLGFFVHMIKKMWKTVGMFVLIFCTFWFVLAIIHVSISRRYISSNHTFLYTVASKGKFEIFGEVHEDDRDGILWKCDNFTRTITDIFEMDYVEASCLFRTSIIPFLVFTYIFVTGILLVNLLTAQLTKEYEKESENSRFYSGYLQYEQLAKIESKLYFPPPFSLFYICIRFLLAILTVVTTAMTTIIKYVVRICFDPTPSFDFCCTRCYRFIWKYFVEILDGDTWGAVKSNEIETKENEVEKEIKGFLEKSPNEIWKKMKNVINNFEDEDLTVENLKNVQIEIIRLIGDEICGVMTRERVETRIEMRIDGMQDDPSEETDIPKYLP